MIYQISNIGAAIIIVCDDAKLYVMKHHVTGIKVIDFAIVKIERGDPLAAIYLRHSEVFFPVHPNALSLMAALNSMITGCVCRATTTGGDNGQAQ